jgi:hypothetical protein
MDIKQIKRGFEAVRTERQNWDVMFQILGEYVSLVKQNFQNTPQQGEFLTSEIFDSTGVFAAQSSASALLGMLWPASAKQALEIAPPDDLEINTGLADFYSKMTNRLAAAMDDPNAGLSMALDEYMLDQMIFGTSGVGVEEGDTSKLLFKPYGVKESYIEEGRGGRVAKVFLFYEWTVERVVAEYGEDKCSEKTRKKYQNGKLNDKVKILHAIVPRTVKKAEKGKLAMPYASYHLEWDADHFLKEDGFHELPIIFSRFRKLNYERYGRSPAMNALPDIREANVLREAVIVATEKVLDMPKGVLDDGMLGGSVLDTSARAINVFNASGNVSSGNPVFDIGTPPDVSAALNRLEQLSQTIAQHFFIDRLIDMNNDQRMTFGETQIRDAIRTASLSALFARQLTEMFTPLVSRCVNILWRMGEFGVIAGSEEEAEALVLGVEPEYVPDEIAERLAQGKDIYQIIYKTKAANASRAEEYLAILDVMNVTMQGMNVDPSLANRVNMHEAIKLIGGIRGLPVGVVRQDDEVEAKTQQQQAQAAQAQMVEAAPKLAAAARDAGMVDQ